MAGCVSCFVLPLLLFIFHRYIQPLILKFWNPWAKVEDKQKSSEKEDLQPKLDNKSKYTDVNAPLESTKGDCCARG